jgi:hypothetical protein
MLLNRACQKDNPQAPGWRLWVRAPCVEFLTRMLRPQSVAASSPKVFGMSDKSKMLLERSQLHTTPARETEVSREPEEVAGNGIMIRVKGAYGLR